MLKRRVSTLTLAHLPVEPLVGDNYPSVIEYEKTMATGGKNIDVQGKGSDVTLVAIMQAIREDRLADDKKIREVANSITGYKS